jgi:hypothetical protein
VFLHIYIYIYIYIDIKADFVSNFFNLDCIAPGMNDGLVEMVCCGRIDDDLFPCEENPLAKALRVLLAEADLDRRALSSPGTLQYQTLNWLVYDDPGNLDSDFDLVPPGVLLERFLMALLYFSTAGETWDNSFGFLSASSVCSWKGIDCDVAVVESHPVVVRISMYLKHLRGQLPTELSLLSKLEYLHLGKFATVSSSEMDALELLGSLSYNLSPLWCCRI